MIPVIFVHSNNAFYLDFSLNQVHLSNPGNPIYLIGSNVDRKYDFVNYASIDEYRKEADAFAKVYKHMSFNSHDFELFCFQRWFVLKEFCSKNKIDKFLYLDSDALIFCNIDSYFSNLGNYKFTVSNRIAPHCCYFSSLKSLNDFCNFIIKLYTDPSYTSRFESKYSNHVKNNIPGGVCDMTAFGEFQNDFPGSAKDLAVIENKQVFDDNMNSSDGFVMNEGIKKITFKNGQPYGTLISGGEVKFNLLHFQGKAKQFLPDYYRGKNLDHIKTKLARDRFLKNNNLLQRVAKKLGYKFIS